jgi:aldose 1-epimerase
MAARLRGTTRSLYGRGVYSPSGRQFELALGDQQAVVTEVGAGLRTYSVAGRDLLDGYGAGDTSPSGRGQVLIPWPNRIAGGKYEFDGRSHQLPLTEAGAGNAIHGLVRWNAWELDTEAPDRVALRHRLRPQPGYPFELALAIQYALTESGLSVRTSTTNAGEQPCPFGAGAHPYLTLGTVPVDPLELLVPAGTVLLKDDDGIPTKPSPVEGGEFDFRSPRLIGSTVLDNAFTDLARGDDGMARAALSDKERAVELWVGEAYTHLMVFTGDPLPDVNRRAVAIEPMTCPPNAFQTGDGVIRLEPGESVELAWGIRPLTPTG